MVHVFWKTNYFKVYLSLKVNIWGTGCAEAIHFSLTLRSTLTKVLVFRELCTPNPPNICYHISLPYRLVMQQPICFLC